MLRVVWSLEALRILTTLPAPVRRDILKKSGLLQEFPLMHHLRRRGRYRGQRYFVSHEYLIYYVVRTEMVSIITIGHGRRRGA